MISNRNKSFKENFEKISENNIANIESIKAQNYKITDNPAKP